MKKKFALFFIISATFGTNQIVAQNESKPKEFIVIKFLLPNQSEYERFEVPINKIFSKDNETGEARVSHCLNPKNEECRKIVYSSYDVSANSFLISKNKSRIIFNIEVADGCKTRKVFDVIRKRQTKIRLNCEVELIAYYAIKGKEAN